MATGTRKPRGVLYAMIVGFLALSFIFKRQELILGAGGLALVGAFSKTAADGIERLWMRIGYMLGRMNSALLLSIAYLLALTPLALCRRFMTRKKGVSTTSGFIIRNHVYSSDDLLRTW